MKQLFPRGKRIRPTDKDLVFHTALAALFPVFLLVVLLFHIRQIAGVSPSQACREYTHPAFINENLARLLNIDVSHIGHKLNEFDEFSDSLSTIAGIFKNFPLNSLEEEIGGQQISIGMNQSKKRKTLFSRTCLPAVPKKPSLTFQKSTTG